MDDIYEIAKEDGITLNGYSADFYEYENDRILIMERDLGDGDNGLASPKMLLVSQANFKNTVIKNKGKF